MTEIWLPVPGITRVQASSEGRIRTKDRIVKFKRLGGVQHIRMRATVFRPYVAKNGYEVVAFQWSGKRRKYLVHRLVGRAFVKGYKPGLTINHINGIKTDNRPANLEWVTLAKNTSLQWETGLATPKGEAHRWAKLNNAQVLEIRRRRIAGESRAGLALEYSVSTATIYAIARGLRWSRLKSPSL